MLKGVISLENYGGFSSIKTSYKKTDLSEFKGVTIRFKSSNQKFAFTLEDSEYWFKPNYKKEFSASKDNTWEEVTLWFKYFKELVIGQPSGNGFEMSKLKNIVRLGEITSEKKEGPFTLEIDYIRFVK